MGAFASQNAEHYEGRPLGEVNEFTGIHGSVQMALAGVPGQIEYITKRRPRTPEETTMWLEEIVALSFGANGAPMMHVRMSERRQLVLHALVAGISEMEEVVIDLRPIITRMTNGENVQQHCRSIIVAAAVWATSADRVYIFMKYPVTDWIFNALASRNMFDKYNFNPRCRFVAVIKPRRYWDEWNLHPHPPRELQYAVNVSVYTTASNDAFNTKNDVAAAVRAVCDRGVESFTAPKTEFPDWIMETRTNKIIKLDVSFWSANNHSRSFDRFIGTNLEEHPANPTPVEPSVFSTLSGKYQYGVAWVGVHRLEPNGNGLFGIPLGNPRANRNSPNLIERD